MFGYCLVLVWYGLVGCQVRVNGWQVGLWSRWRFCWTELGEGLVGAQCMASAGVVGDLGATEMDWSKADECGWMVVWMETKTKYV